MRTHRISIAFVVLALLAAACGSDERLSASPAPASTTEPTSIPTPTSIPPATSVPTSTSIPPADEALDSLPILYQEFIADSGGSKWVEVFGSQMHYVEVGDPAGEVILLGHGAPTNAFLWRDVIDGLAMPGRRVIAFDLIGFGRSDHPDLDYSFATHSTYMEGFIDALDLRNIHLVLHDVSGQAGFGYAAANPDNVASITSGEVLYRSFESFDEMGPFAGPLFQQLQTAGVGEVLMIDQNMAIAVLLDSGTARELPAEIRDVYGSFFADPELRDVNLEFALSTPVGGEPIDAADFVDTYAAWLTQTQIPKLILRPDAGLVPGVQYETAADLPNVAMVELSRSSHFFQEDDPTGLTEALNAFYDTLGF